MRSETLLPGMVMLLLLPMPAPAGDPGPTEVFRRGEVNDDGNQDLTDAIVILTHLFLGGRQIFCLDAADVNDDGRVDIADPIRLLNYLFAGSEAPPPPYAEPGRDPTEDALRCDRCKPGLARPAHLACSAGEPCTVREDSPIDPIPHFRNDAPAIALDSAGVPHVLYSVAEGGYHGFHAVRMEDGGWSIQEIREKNTAKPVELATADLAGNDSGGLLALINSGDLHTRLWELEGTAWRNAGEAENLEGGYNHGLERSAGGCLYAAFATSAGAPGIGVFSGGVWSFTPADIGGSAGLKVLALSAEGDARIAYWSADGDAGWILRWAGGPAGPEAVMPLGSSSLERQQIGFELTNGPDGPRPHFLVMRPDAARPGGFTLDYIARGDDGEWQVITVAHEEPPSPCPEPATEGDTCERVFQTYHPHRIVSDAQGSVLLLYSIHEHRALLTARCRGGVDPVPPNPALGPPPPLCVWEGPEEVEGELMAAHRKDGALQSAVIAPGIAPFSLDVAVDARGSLHLAVYDVSSPSGFSVRYLRLATP